MRSQKKKLKLQSGEMAGYEECEDSLYSSYPY